MNAKDFLKAINKNEDSDAKAKVADAIAKAANKGERKVIVELDINTSQEVVDNLLDQLRDDGWFVSVRKDFMATGEPDGIYQSGYNSIKLTLDPQAKTYGF